MVYLPTRKLAIQVILNCPFLLMGTLSRNLAVTHSRLTLNMLRSGEYGQLFSTAFSPSTCAP